MKLLTAIFVCCLLGATAVNAAPADGGVNYFCTSAEIKPAIHFTVAVLEASDLKSATVLLNFPQAQPPTTEYDNVSYDSADSGSDHIAFAKTGIVVVIYPNPQILSTVTIGDAGGTQVGLAMHCHAANNKF